MKLSSQFGKQNLTNIKAKLGIETSIYSKGL